MRLNPAFAVVLLTLACGQARGPERLSLDDREAMRRSACRQAAWDKCDGERDHADCVEREALPCNTPTENKLLPKSTSRPPPGLGDSAPEAPDIEPVR